jgi:hypothetical protein
MCYTTFYLAVTDASGSVARQQKIAHAHESPFYHYAQVPHPIASTYHGKKYSRILFGQTTYENIVLWLTVAFQWQFEQNNPYLTDC